MRFTVTCEWGVQIGPLCLILLANQLPEENFCAIISSSSVDLYHDKKTIMSLFLWLNTGYFLIVAIISEIPAMIYIMEAIDGGILSPTLYNSTLQRTFGDNICNKHSIQVILINTNKNIFKLVKLITISLNRKYIHFASKNWFYN